ncbi:Fanconi anemia group B protein-like [Haliotis asinina]|uniref:Fanconi anemia group B protein-like n=1 Tax=Haliotis asinina TaxID=109174 RepID=UPI0035325117
MYIRGPHAFCCNGALYEAFIDEKSGVNMNVYSVNRSTTSPAVLTLHENIVFTPKGKRLIIQQAGTFTDANTGVKKPFLLVRDDLSQSHYLLTVMNTTGNENNTGKNKLGAIRKLVCMKDDVLNNVKIVDGPMIIWTCDQNVNIGFTTKEKQTIFDKHSFPVLDLEKQVSHFTVISTVSTIGGLLMFIKHSCKNHQSDEEDLFQGLEGDEISLDVWSVKQNTDNKSWTQRKLDSSHFLPAQYSGAIVDCLVKIKPPNSSDGEEQMESDVVLLLDGGYIVTLRNGRLLNCCQVDSSVTSFHEWYFIGLFDSTTAVIKMSPSEVIIVDSGSGKVTKTWSEVSNAMIGDFLQCGHTQILVTFTEESSHDEGTSWMLTDLAMCEIHSGQWTPDEEDDHGDDSSSKGKALALKALFNNLQSSAVNLCSAEQHLSNKVKFLHSTWAHLQHLTGGGETTLPLPEVPLLTLKDDGSLKAKITDQNLPGIKTIVSWHTSIGCLHVIGVDVHNGSNRTLHCCTLSLVQHSTMTEAQDISSVSKWLPHVSSDNTDHMTSEAHSAKRLKLNPLMELPTMQQKELPLRPGDRKMLTVSFDGMEVGVQHGWKLWVFLMSREHVPTVSESGDQTEGTPKELTVCCGSVAMTTEDYLKGTYAIAPDLTSGSVRDPEVIQSSLSSIQTCNTLVLTSAFTDLTHTAGIIEAQTHFQHAATLSCLCPVNCPPLQYVRITSVSVLSQTKVHVCVWTRDSNQLNLLVAYLSSHLPDDVIISHNEDAELQCAVKDAVSCLSQEVKTLSMSVKTLLEDSSQAVKALMSSSASVAGVTHQDQVSDFQQRFREEQDAVHSCVDTRVTVRDTRVLRNNICRLQRLTDEHMACMKSTD